jgi:hypothetical protein
MAGSAVPTNPQWRKSTYSAETNCVEVAALDGRDVALRNSDAGDVVVSVSREDFRAFVLGAKAGEFDDLT